VISFYFILSASRPGQPLWDPRGGRAIDILRDCRVRSLLPHWGLGYSLHGTAAVALDSEDSFFWIQVGNLSQHYHVGLFMYVSLFIYCLTFICSKYLL
jgi:hypothetical protein